MLYIDGLQICSQNDYPPKHENTTVEGLWMSVFFFHLNHLNCLKEKYHPFMVKIFFLDIEGEKKIFLLIIYFHENI